MEKQKVKEKVKYYLETIPKTRDDDPLLYCYLLKDFWIETKHIYYQMKELSPESVTRCRRKRQEEIPRLRWKLYNMRKHLEEEKREEFKQPFLLSN